MPLRKKALKKQIDDNLKLIFEEDAGAELPDRLIDLLAQLDRIELPPPEADAAAPRADRDGGSS